MAQVDIVNYFSIIIWFNLLFLFFYMLNYMYILPLIYVNLFIRSKILYNFINNNKLIYNKIYLLQSRDIEKSFNSHDLFKMNINIFNIYSFFATSKILLC